MIARLSALACGLILCGTATAYCPSSANNSSLEYVDAVDIDGVENVSGNDGGYADYSLPAIELAGRTFDVVLTPGFSGSTYTEAWSVWVDSNADGAFTAAERVFTGSGPTAVAGTISLPAGAEEGETGLRVAMSYGAAQTDPCATFTYGEVEDYRIVVPPAPGGGGSGSAQTPWQDNAPASLLTGIAWRYAMGYHFVPAVDGRVTALGGLFDGAKTVRLYDRVTGQKLAETTVSAANDWAYTALAAPVEVHAGQGYTVVVYLNGSGGAYHYGLPAPFPQVYGDVEILGSTYVYTGTQVDPEIAPTNTYTGAMLGVADIAFEPLGAPPPISLACDEDVLDGVPVTGTLALGPSADMVPLCSGVVLIGDRATHEVKAVDVADGAVLAAYALSGPPGAMTPDRAGERLYVAVDGIVAVAEIDLATGDVVEIPVVHPAISEPTGIYDLTLADDGKLLAVVQDGPSYFWTDRPVAIVDPALGVVASVFEPGSNGRGATLIEFDHANAQVVAADEGFSPSSLVSYAYDGTTLVELDYRWNAGGNGQDLAISADGAHLAFACGGGNGAGYTVFDFSPVDFAVTAGEWSTGPYPRSVHFSSDSTSLAASNGYDLQVFDVAGHVLAHEVTPDLAGCSYSQIERVRFSGGGAIVYGFSNCGFDDDSGRLVWTVPGP